MAPAAPATSPGHDLPSGVRRRGSQRAISRRALLQLLAGVLVVGLIPVVATYRILGTNALQNERARADSALRGQLQGAGQELGQLGDDAASRADDLARSPALQHAFIAADRETIKRIAAGAPGVLFYLHGAHVAGTRPPIALARSISLTVNGERIGTVVATIALNRRLAARLRRVAPHGRDDRLLIVRERKVVGTGQRIQLRGHSVQVGGESYRALLSRVPNAVGISLFAVRPEKTINASVQPYQHRIFYAALGSFALLVLVVLMFARPILNTLGDFRRVASQAATDGLTGLANRRSFDDELALEWRRAERVGDSLALVLVDLDDFKSINDEFGHQAGDAVLRRVAAILDSGGRHADLAARYGGEEFALLTPETELTGATKLAERLRAELEAATIELPHGGKRGVTASFGVAVKGELEGAEQLVAAADEALYEAKRSGKNRVVAAQPQPNVATAVPV
ncbi:MAG: GGDEF domain-containing protein [Actinobacteria bacterium]|nr:MAG: GGDEF domain-containing protein [Actinomycetota bacterium]TMM27446.1 MAG: GGDEF domain-containing protein [Actinomycetota bacterium]